MYKPYENHLQNIIQKLQLEQNDPKKTLDALIKIFTSPKDDNFNPHDYPIDKTDTSEITLLSDEIEKEGSLTGEKLLTILLASKENFEEKLGIYDSEGGIWSNFRSGLFLRNQIKTGSATILTSRRAQKIKAGKFDKLPYTRKYQIINYCINVDKKLFTEEEILQEKGKTVTNDDKKQLIQILSKYNLNETVDEMIKLGDYNFMFCISTKEIFGNKHLHEKIRKMCRDKFEDDDKEIFESYVNKYGKE